MGGRHSRNKGARVERELVKELLSRGWTDVVRVPLSGAIKTRTAFEDDVAGKPPGSDTELRIECKARAVGFESIYAMLAAEVVIPFAIESSLLVMSLEPCYITTTAHEYLEISGYTKSEQKVLRSVFNKCKTWIGNAHVLVLKQDRKPFIYVRYVP